jgi:hypothetical protein
MSTLAQTKIEGAVSASSWEKAEEAFQPCLWGWSFNQKREREKAKKGEKKKEGKEEKNEMPHSYLSLEILPQS